MSLSNAPNANAGQEDFIKGWPARDMLERPEFVDALRISYDKALSNIGSCMNYGTLEEGAWMRGHPTFLTALSEFLSSTYQRPVDSETLLSTSGCSAGTVLSALVFAEAGDVVVCEAPTYYLCHQMFRERGLVLMEVDILEDGMDLDALEVMLKAQAGRVKLVHTIPVHHNPTGWTMCDAKRRRLMSLAREHEFYVIADEAYQLLYFDRVPAAQRVLPLHYYDDEADPRCVSLGSFSKLIGPGVKVGWIQAHRPLLPRFCNTGVFQSGNNPVTFASSSLAHFVASGALQDQIRFVTTELARKCRLMIDQLRAVGYEAVNEPVRGHFEPVFARVRIHQRL